MSDLVERWDDFKENCPSDHAEAAEAMWDLGDSMADRITALEAEVARLTEALDAKLQVKPLIWTQPWDGKDEYWSEPPLFLYVGLSKPSGYRVKRYAHLQEFCLFGPGHMGGLSYFPSLEEAKAACQADYEARIRAALEEAGG